MKRRKVPENLVFSRRPDTGDVPCRKKHCEASVRRFVLPASTEGTV